MAQMNSRLAILIASVLAVLGLIVGLIVWSAREFRRVESSVEALRGQSALLSDQYLARVQALNVAFLRFELGGQAPDWNRYLEQGRELSAWLRTQQATPGLGEAERRSLARVQDAYADYFQRVRLYGDSRLLGADRYPVKVARAELEVAVGNLLALGSELSNARQTRVDGLIQDTRNALGRITILALVTVVGLLLLIGWQARELYRRHVAPLRLQVVTQSEQLERQEKSPPSDLWPPGWRTRSAIPWRRSRHGSSHCGPAWPETPQRRRISMSSAARSTASKASSAPSCSWPAHRTP